MLEMAQHASFLIEGTGWSSNSCSAGRAEQLMTNCVCTSSPVNMLPIALSEGVMTPTVGCLPMRKRIERNREIKRETVHIQYMCVYGS